MAHLRFEREEEHAFAILVLQAVQRLAVELGRVQLHLASRIGILPELNLSGLLLDELRIGPGEHQI